MAAAKLRCHKVNINDRRRDLKKKNDLLSRDVNPDALRHVFDTYYRDQVRALYRAVERC
ncbi:MAG: hypothetical protein GF408_04275 [Candidatus Omnitrophica bacterium]|nr:hypothetical protein [Candidatus Omnitrophota bacterium]